MYSIDPARALRIGVWLLLGLLLAVGIRSLTPSGPSDNPAYDALATAHTRRMAADSVALAEARRVIEIEMKVTRATAWFYLFHEKAHADFDEYGCTFPEMRDSHGDNPLEERACNAVATSRIRDMRAALSRPRGAP